MSTMNHIDPDDLALFAMQLLSEDEAAAVRQHLRQCPQCTHELAEAQGDLAVYATATEMHAAPATARERLLAQVAREPKARSAERFPERSQTSSEHPETFSSGSVPVIDRLPTRRLHEAGPARERTPLTRVFPWAGWAVAAALAVTAGALYRHDQDLRSTMARDHAELDRLTQDAASARAVLETLKDPSATRVTLTRSKEAPAPQGKVTYVPDKGSLLFVASNIAPPPPDKVYELWLIPANGRDPMPAGTFHPDANGNASIILPQLPAGTVAKAFGITIENEGGSPTPTLPVIMAGAAAGI